MKIAIDLTALYGRRWTGIEFYAVDLYKALLTTAHEIIPIIHEHNEIDESGHAYIIPHCSRLVLENLALSKAIRKINADIVFFPVFPPPIDIYFGCKSKIFKVVHDLVHFEYRETIPFAAKYYYTPKIIWMLKKADAIITISETTRKKLSKYTKLPVYNCGENIASEYRCCQTRAKQEHLNKWNLEQGKYLISVSTIEPRKNLKYLLNVVKPMLEEKGMKLVLVGKKRPSQDKELEMMIGRLGDRLIFTEYVDVDYLISLYKYSFAFILLSIYEGFGRTPFEAVACGCKRIILSDIEVFHETFDGNATFLPLNDLRVSEDCLRNENFVEVQTDFKIPFDVLEFNITKLLNNISN